MNASIGTCIMTRRLYGLSTGVVGELLVPPSQWVQGITLQAADAATGYDFGTRAARATGRVWHDRNANGRQDDGEPGVAGVAVELLDADDNPVATAAPVFTDAAGLYTVPLDGLWEGDYRVRVRPPVSRGDGTSPLYRLTTKNQGDDQGDSDFCGCGKSDPQSIGAPAGRVAGRRPGRRAGAGLRLGGRRRRLRPDGAAPSPWPRTAAWWWPAPSRAPWTSTRGPKPSS